MLIFLTFCEILRFAAFFLKYPLFYLILKKLNVGAMLNKFSRLNIEGDIFTDDVLLTVYSTDASVYKEKPLAVVRPKNKNDISEIVKFASENKLAVVPRTAGTSLAGQVVGNGIIADVSKYMTEIIELNTDEKWVRVQPGVVLDELNKFLEPHGLFFGPETSTSNRCMIGGMVGNNSAGNKALIYGSTRDHLLSVKAILSDGSDVEFGNISKETFCDKTNKNSLEGEIYRSAHRILGDASNRNEILKEFPDPKLKRRNTGYAIDLLLDNSVFNDSKEEFNFCKLIAGSEGTLAFIYEIKLNLVPLLSKNRALVCVHLNSVNESLFANLIALKYNPISVELMDKAIMDLAGENLTQQKNRFFLQGDPGALLIVEFAEESFEIINEKASALEAEMRAAGYGFHFPMVKGAEMKNVWDLRKSGLGVMSNIPGDKKPVSVIEDTAVLPELLPEYIIELEEMLKKLGLECLYYAHISTGELHTKPVLNLKDPKDVELFHTVALETAKLVKKYRGSISGEHGDGRLRGEFIPFMIGAHNYELIKQIKKVWDPNNIFNPGKIVNTPKMNEFLRFEAGKPTRDFDTIFDFSKDIGLIRAIEKCNGSADCRKSEIIGGTMCPSFMATKDENCSTRARANILREYLTNSTKKNPFDHKEIYEILDLCLSCKGCKSECPSNVDITKYKAEFLQHYYDSNGIKLRTRLIAYITDINKLGSIVPGVFNFFVTNKFFSGIAKYFLSFAPKRSIPKLYKYTLHYWFSKYSKTIDNTKLIKGKVFLFADEFTEYNDTEIGISAVKLLNALGYEVQLQKHDLSGRTFLSKGLLRTAKKIANKNVSLLKDIITEETPLIGIEPSGILTFRDEYTELVDSELKDASKKLAKSCLLFDEFIEREYRKGKIDSELFSKEAINIKLHGHCHQKSLASTAPTKLMLEIPENYKVDEIKSGCCGMAGSFGYEKEHYELSMKVGELVLFPEIRKAEPEMIISAPGTSCRHQIKDGTGKKALHPIEILYGALLNK
jgi:FAD/FMN-containing dehydrogenase/Fe-S oxidoreductase